MIVFFFLVIVLSNYCCNVFDEKDLAQPKIDEYVFHFIYYFPDKTIQTNKLKEVSICKTKNLANELLQDILNKKN